MDKDSLLSRIGTGTSRKLNETDCVMYSKWKTKKILTPRIE